MPTVLVRRLLQVIPTLFGVTVLTFALMQVAPGEPLAQLLAGSADQTLNAGTSSANSAALRHAAGLDQPVPIQFARWLGRLATGDLGTSLINHRPVTELIAAALPNTLELALLALLISLGVGIPLGVLAARFRGTWIDSLVRLLAVAGHAIPTFWLGLVFILVFAVRLRLFPSGSAMSVGASPWDVGDRVRHLVGPVLVLSMAGIANYSRYARTELLDVLGQEYVRAARAKGLPESRVLGSHALRTALLPVITALGGVLASLVSGALVVEQVFAWPGMGRLAFDAAQAKDVPVVLATVLLSSVLLVVGFILRDVAYCLADPRIGRDSWRA